MVNKINPNPKPRFPKGKTHKDMRIVRPIDLDPIVDAINTISEDIANIPTAPHYREFLFTDEELSALMAANGGHIIDNADLGVEAGHYVSVIQTAVEASSDAEFVASVDGVGEDTTLGYYTLTVGYNNVSHTTMFAANLSYVLGGADFARAQGDASGLEYEGGVSIDSAKSIIGENISIKVLGEGDYGPADTLTGTGFVLVKLWYNIIKVGSAL